MADCQTRTQIRAPLEYSAIKRISSMLLSKKNALEQNGNAAPTFPNVRFERSRYMFRHNGSSSLTNVRVPSGAILTILPSSSTVTDKPRAQAARTASMLALGARRASIFASSENLSSSSSIASKGFVCGGEGVVSWELEL